MEKELAKKEETSIGVKMNNIVSMVLSDETVNGFEKGYLIADAITNLRTLLSPDYMKPFMNLQGNRLGFKTDKDNKDGTGGYPESVVKDCIIEAVLMGVQPTGNHFNIIANNCYITKEGFGYLLDNRKGLTYRIIPQLPRIQQDKGSAAVVMKIQWSYNGKSSESDIDFAIKVNQYMGADAVIGKGERKARAWLYKTISGTEISDGDTTDIEYKLVPEYKTRTEEKSELFADKLAVLKEKEEAKKEVAPPADPLKQ